MLKFHVTLIDLDESFQALHADSARPPSSGVCMIWQVLISSTSFPRLRRSASSSGSCEP